MVAVIADDITGAAETVGYARHLGCSCDVVGDNCYHQSFTPKRYLAMRVA